MESEGDGEWRVEFDAQVDFTNGGGLHARGFRLDVAGPDLSDEDVADLWLRQLGLLMAGRVTVLGKRFIRERHKGLRGQAARPDGDAGGGRLVELSHRIEQGMVTYPGLPGPEIDEFLTRQASRARYAPGTEFSIGRITMVGNTGTYLDSPFHRFATGADLAGLPLERLANVEGVLVRVTGSAQRAVDRAALLPYDVRGRAVLMHTGWDTHWGTERYGDGEHPYLGADGAAWLVEQGAALVGIDSLNIDDTADLRRPAHSALLAAGIPLVEHLCNLHELPPQGFRFHAAPPLVAGFGTWPVRAYAIVAGR
jgi:arylformamidase